MKTAQRQKIERNLKGFGNLEGHWKKNKAEKLSKTPTPSPLANKENCSWSINCQSQASMEWTLHVFYQVMISNTEIPQTGNFEDNKSDHFSVPCDTKSEV